jgi:hypothetical protein
VTRGAGGGSRREARPDIAAQLKRKIDLMNARWADYSRLFVELNP